MILWVSVPAADWCGTNKPWVYKSGHMESPKGWYKISALINWSLTAPRPVAQASRLLQLGCHFQLTIMSAAPTRRSSNGFNITLSPKLITRPLPFVSNPLFGPASIYHKELLPRGYGRALWSSAQKVEIGDVGYMNEGKITSFFV